MDYFEQQKMLGYKPGECVSDVKLGEELEMKRNYGVIISTKLRTGMGPMVTDTLWLLEVGAHEKRAQNSTTRCNALCIDLDSV